jgi:hypothetical protein
MEEESRQGSCYTSFLHTMNRLMCCLQCCVPFFTRNVLAPAAQSLGAEGFSDVITEGARVAVILTSVEIDRALDDDDEANNAEHQQLPAEILAAANMAKDAIRTTEEAAMIFLPAIIDSCIAKPGDDQLKPYIESLVASGADFTADLLVSGVNALEGVAYNALIMRENIENSFTTTNEDYAAEESEFNGVRIDTEALFYIGLAVLMFSQSN